MSVITTLSHIIINNAQTPLNRFVAGIYYTTKFATNTVTNRTVDKLQFLSFIFAVLALRLRRAIMYQRTKILSKLIKCF